jgi:hypothetical protein
MVARLKAVNDWKPVTFLSVGGAQNGTISSFLRDARVLARSRPGANRPNRTEKQPGSNSVEPFKAACLVRSSWKEMRNEP